MRSLVAVLVLSVAPFAVAADKAVLVAGGPDGTLVQPFAVDFDGRGRMLVVEFTKGERLVAIENGKVVTLGGTLGKKGFAGDGGPVAKALFNAPHHLVVMPDGTVYVADTFNFRVRKVDPAGTVTTLAGTGVKGFNGDGKAGPVTQFSGVYSLALTPDEQGLFVADLENRRVRRVDLATGVVTTVAGNGKKGVPKDGEPAASQPLFDPRAVAVDPAGNLYVLERGGHALRVVDAKGNIRTVAGTGKPHQGVGPALEAGFNGAKHLCVAADKTVLIADSDNHRVVRYDPEANTVTVVAGTGKKGSAGVGGDPLQAQLDKPHGVAVHPKSGRVFIADSGNDRVLEIVPDKR